MLKENWRSISRIERVGDFLIVVAAFFLAYYSRTALLFWNDVLGWNLPFQGDELAPLKDYFIVLVVGLSAYMVFLHLLRAYSSMRLSTALQLLKVSLLSSILVFFTLAAVLFLLKIDLSRSFIALFCGLVGMFLTIERVIVLRILRFWRRRGRNFRNILVCGVGEQALRLVRQVVNTPELGIRVRGFGDLHEGSAHDPRAVAEFRDRLRAINAGPLGRVIVGPENVARALEDYAIDEVIFTDVVEVMPQVEELIILCSEQGVRTTIAADLFSVGMVKSGISYFGGMPLIHYQTPPGDSWMLALKRWIDVLVSAVLLVLLSPLLAAIAVGILVTSGRPIIFTQTRVGLNGRLFSLYKFRSMRVDAEQELAQLQEMNEMRGPAFKMRNDPRVTGIGRWLRRYSLDELPQLWNVLRGDMSLVGPRPPVPGEVSMYERKNRRRLSMRPGLTCTWQVSGRNEIVDFDSWVRLDLEYIDNWSLGRDLLLLLRTIPAVLFGTGAR